MATTPPNRAGIVRPPAVAGTFYPAESDELFEAVHRSFLHPLGPGKFPSRSVEMESYSSQKIDQRAECVIVPHAGYEYSGPVAAHSYLVVSAFLKRFKGAEKIIAVILGPNHYGNWIGVALSPSESWLTPLGEVRVETDLVRRIAKNSSIMDLDSIAHSREHSIEVQLPFLQAVSMEASQKIRIVPVSLMLQDYDTVTEVASELSGIASDSDYPFLFIGSSDLTHYEPVRVANEKDSKLLSEVERLDLSSFYNVLERLNVSACGYGAIACVMNVSRTLGKQRGQVLKYATSGDTAGNFSSVVGYPSVRFS